MAREGANAATEKRFSIPDGSIGHDRLVATQTAIHEIQSEHPEVLSLCCFGSSTTGAARETSDIDGWLFVDVSKLAAQTDLDEDNFVETKDIKRPYGTRKSIQLKKDVREKYNQLIRSKLKQEQGLTDEQVQHIRAVPVSSAIIDVLVEDLYGWDTKLQQYYSVIEENNRRLDAHDTNTISAKMPDRPSLGILPDMFHLAVGRGIEPWRTVLLAKLVSLGKPGDRIWQEIITNTEMIENHMNSGTNKAYPRDLDQAIKVYG